MSDNEVLQEIVKELKKDDDIKLLIENKEINFISYLNLLVEARKITNEEVKKEMNKAIENAIQDLILAQKAKLTNFLLIKLENLLRTLFMKFISSQIDN